MLCFPEFLNPGIPDIGPGLVGAEVPDPKLTVFAKDWDDEALGASDVRFACLDAAVAVQSLIRDGHGREMERRPTRGAAADDVDIGPWYDAAQL